MAGEYPPNKWGYQGFNCKWLPSGSGTTHANRREQRRQKQWDWMAQHQPDSEASLAEQAAALEKAALKAKQKLEELQEKKREAAQQEEEESYSYYSPSPPKKQPKKGRSKKGTSLEKDRSLSVRRTRTAKHGQKESLLEVKEEEDEKDGQALGKATSSEKATSSAMADHGQKDEKMPEKPLEKGEKAVQKDKKEEEEKKEEATSSVTLTPAKKFLEEEGKEALEKAKVGITLRPRMPKRVVVVDWHNSLEKEDTVPEAHQESLEKLIQVAEVHILSYVASRERMAQVHQDVKNMVRCKDQLAGVHTCWQKVGYEGKAAYCHWLKAEAIFDDDEKICQDCFGKGIRTFALMTGKTHHNDLPSGNVYRDFPEAVQEYLDSLT